MELEDLRKAALAYYNNSSLDVQHLTCNFFKSMDTNGDGRVNQVEFMYFLEYSGYGWLHGNTFEQLDRNNDGLLDFWDVLTLYYMIKTRDFVCKSCRICLRTLYFTCVYCFDVSNDPFDLCSDCYGEKKFSHPHTLFHDNYVLLRYKRASSNSSSLAVQQTSHHPPATTSRINWWNAFRALEVAIAAGALASSVSGCTVM